jgi:hypothetical protein
MKKLKDEYDALLMSQRAISFTSQNIKKDTNDHGSDHEHGHGYPQPPMDNRPSDAHHVQRRVRPAMLVQMEEGDIASRDAV